MTVAAGLTGFLAEPSRLSRLTLRVESPVQGGNTLEWRLPAPAGGTEAVTQTLHAMRGIAWHHAETRARVALPGRAASIFGFLKSGVRFRRDPSSIELLRHPAGMMREIVEKGWAEGDCDDRAMLGASACRLARIPCRFVVISQHADPAMPWQHVYLHIQSEHGGRRWIACDPQETRKLGDEVPQARRMTMDV